MYIQSDCIQITLFKVFLDLIGLGINGHGIGLNGENVVLHIAAVLDALFRVELGIFKYHIRKL